LLGESLQKTQKGVRKISNKTSEMPACDMRQQAFHPKEKLKWQSKRLLKFDRCLDFDCNNCFGALIALPL